MQYKPEYKRCTLIAAEAIAVHNIHKSVSDADIRELNRSGVTIGEYLIPLREESIAYLLRLCDELQFWDHQRFDEPKDFTIDGDKFKNTPGALAVFSAFGCLPRDRFI